MKPVELVAETLAQPKEDVYDENDQDISHHPEKLVDELGRAYDDAYFDEEFGVYEEPPIPLDEYVNTKQVKLRQVPVPTNKYPEPVFGRFVSVKDL